MSIAEYYHEMRLDFEKYDTEQLQTALETYYLADNFVPNDDQLDMMRLVLLSRGVEPRKKLSHIKNSEDWQGYFERAKARYSWKD